MNKKCCGRNYKPAFNIFFVLQLIDTIEGCLIENIEDELNFIHCPDVGAYIQVTCTYPDGRSYPFQPNASASRAIPPDSSIWLY